MRVHRAAGPVVRSFLASRWPLAAAALTLWVVASPVPSARAAAGGPPATGPSESGGPRGGGSFGPSGGFGSGVSGGGSSGGSSGGGGYSGDNGVGSSGGSSGGGSGDSGTTASGNHGGNGGNGSGNGGNGSGNGGHGGDGHHNGGHNNGGHGGGGFRGGFGYHHPAFWGSVFLGWPYPYWYYGPWGFYAYDDYDYRERRSEQGALDLDLSPADTQVYLNGQYIGIVDNFDGWPQYLWLDPGTYDVIFYREGYKTLARQVTIYRGLVIDWDDKLERGPSIRPEDLETKTHERRDARIEQDREMSERHEVREERREDPKQDGETRAGRLRLTVEPRDASVYLDGRFLGTGDDVARGSGLWIAPGEHTLSVVRPGRHAEEQRFELKPGGEVELRIELKNE